MNHPLKTLDLLAQQIREMETANRPTGESLSSGCASMDRCLPNRGYASGSMIELVRTGPGSGVSSLALMIAKQAIEKGKYLLVLDTQKQLYPPAIKSLGVPLERIIVLHPNNHTDAVWAMDQGLRCSAVGAVIAEIGHLEDRVARRLQLATEQGGGLGILLRDRFASKSHPSWADVQWLVRESREAQEGTASFRDASVDPPRWVDLMLTRCVGGRVGARLTIGIDSSGKWVEAPIKSKAYDEQASTLRLAAELAKPANRRREVAG
jgi:protein ImuA